MAESSERPNGGVARRRRERRMRSWFHHEQQSIRMSQATVLHHSYDRAHTEHGAPRSQNTATRALEGGESDEKKYTAKFRKTPPPQAFSQLYDEEDAEWGLRPGSVFVPVPQGRVLRHVVEHRIEPCPFVQILDAPVPQLGDQVLELLQKIVTASLLEPVQVLAVPKISMGCTPQRSAVRRTKMAEQLMYVPTEPGYALAVIATKALGWRAAAALAEQIVDNPVPQGRRGGGRRSSSFSIRTEFSSIDCGAER